MARQKHVFRKEELAAIENMARQMMFMSNMAEFFGTNENTFKDRLKTNTITNEYNKEITVFDWIKQIKAGVLEPVRKGIYEFAKPGTTKTTKKVKRYKYLKHKTEDGSGRTEHRRKRVLDYVEEIEIEKTRPPDPDCLGLVVNRDLVKEGYTAKPTEPPPPTTTRTITYKRIDSPKPKPKPEPPADGG